MTEGISQDQALVAIHARLCEEVAEEEAEAIAAEAVENQQAALSLRVPASLAAQLKARADAEHIPRQRLCDASSPKR